MRWLILVLPFLFACSREVGFRYLPVENELETKTETYRIKELVTNPVDVLWVIDNSGSMDDDINNVSQNIPGFFDKFIQIQGANWKMGMLSTDSGQAPFLGFATSFDVHSSNPTFEFQAALQRLVQGGSDIEELYNPVMRHLTSYPNFTRPGADLAIISVTDEDEQSRTVHPQQFEKFLAALPNPPKRVMAYGVLAVYDPPRCYGFQYANSRYEDFMNYFKGKQFDLCSNQFGNELLELGKDVVSLMEKRRIPLTRVPRPGTLKVLHRGNVLPGGPEGNWTYNPEANAIEMQNLDFAVGDLEEVSIQYQPYG